MNNDFGELPTRNQNNETADNVNLNGNTNKPERLEIVEGPLRILFLKM